MEGFQNNFCRPLFTIIFGYRFHFEGKTDVWISQVRRIKKANVEDSQKKVCVREKKWEWLASETRKKEQKSLFCKPFSSMTEHTVYDKSNHCLPGQNGMGEILAFLD